MRLWFCWQNPLATLSILCNPGSDGALSFLPELLRLATVGTAEGADKMGSPLGHLPEPGLLWIVKWLS